MGMVVGQIRGMNHFHLPNPGYHNRSGKTDQRRHRLQSLDCRTLAEQIGFGASNPRRGLHVVNVVMMDNSDDVTHEVLKIVFDRAQEIFAATQIATKVAT